MRWPGLLPDQAPACLCLLILSVLQQGDAGVIGAFKHALTASKGRVKLAVLDHIGSFPPVVFAVEALCRLCRAAVQRACAKA
jgi:hypothetical protein